MKVAVLLLALVALALSQDASDFVRSVDRPSDSVLSADRPSDSVFSVDRPSDSVFSADRPTRSNEFDISRDSQDPHHIHQHDHDNSHVRHQGHHHSFRSGSSRSSSSSWETLIEIPTPFVVLCILPVLAVVCCLCCCRRRRRAAVLPTKITKEIELQMPAAQMPYIPVPPAPVAQYPGAQPTQVVMVPAASLYPQIPQDVKHV